MGLLNFELLEVVGGTDELIVGRHYTALYRSSSFRQVRSIVPNWEIREARWFHANLLPADAPEFVRYCVERASVGIPTSNGRPQSAP